MLAILAGLISVAYLPMILSAATAPRWGLIAVGGAICLLGVRRVHLTLGHLFGLAFLLYAGASICWAPVAWDGAGLLFQLVALGGCYLVAAETEDLGPFWDALSIGLAFNAIFAVAQVLGHKWGIVLTGMPAGLMLNKDWLSEAAVPVLIAQLVRRRWWGLAGPIVCIAIPHAREAVLALWAAAMILVWIYWRKGFLISLVGSVVLLYGLAGLDAHFFANGPDMRADSDDARLVMWQIGFANLKLFGWGLAATPVVLPMFQDLHSEPLEWAFELGVGSLFLWGVFVHGISSGIRIRRVPETAAFAALLVGSFVYFPLHIPTTAFLASCLAGHLSGARACARRDEPYFRDYREEDLSLSERFRAAVGLQGFGHGRAYLPS